MESTEVQLARVQEQLKIMIEGQIEEKEARRRREGQMEKLADGFASLDRRMEAVERQLATSTPTIEEFTRIKYQVHGAGMMGKWLWAVGAFLIGVVFTSREFVQQFLQEMTK